MIGQSVALGDVQLGVGHTADLAYQVIDNFKTRYEQATKGPIGTVNLSAAAATLM